MIGFHIAEASDKFSLCLAIYEAKERHPQYFRDDTKVASFFGSPAVIWNGGRLSYGGFYPERIKATLNEYNNRGIPYRFTFTNPHITEEHLGDKRGNLLLDIADNGLNEVIVNSPLLEEHIRKTHPNMKITSSTCKCIRNMDDVKAELAKDYSLVVLDYNFNDKMSELEKLTVEERKRCELLVNAFCIPNCPRRALHYDIIGKVQMMTVQADEKGVALTEQDYRNAGIENFECDHHGGNPYEKPHTCLMIEPEDLYEKYVPMGFENFKLEGRAENMMVVADSAARYLARPECYNEAVFFIMRYAFENKHINM